MQSKELASSISKGLNVFGNVFEFASITKDTLNKFYEMEALANADEMYCEMLSYLEANCKNDVVQKAVGNLRYTISNSVEETMKYLRDTIIEAGVGELVDIAVDKACDAFPVSKIIKSSYDFGVSFSNTFLHTGDVQRLKDCMRSEVYIGNCLSSWVLENQKKYNASIGTSKQNEAAKELYYSMYMLWQTRIEGEKTLQSMMEKSFSDWSECYNVSGHVSNALESFKDSVFTQDRNEALLGITVACPVDVVCMTVMETL